MKPPSCLPRAVRLAPAAASLLLLVSTSATEFFVAPNGSDADPGTAARPFASLEKARDAVRALNHGAVRPTGGVTVWIGEGTHLRNQTFELTAADSGTPESPIIYRSPPGRTVRLVGGRFINNLQPVQDSGVQGRLTESARQQVLTADLRAIGLTNPAPLHTRGFGRPLTPAHAELFFDGQPMILARWPNEGAWERIAGFPDATARGDDHGGRIGDLSAGFRYAGDRPNRWAASTNIWVHGYWSWDWANSYERVDAFDLAQHSLTTAPPYGLYGFRQGQRFCFLNVLEELDQPGEYYIDPATARLYFWPPHPVDASELLVSVLPTPLISAQDASHVVFHGLILEASCGTGIRLQGGASNRIEACRIRLMGNHGVTIDGGRGHSVIACDIENTGDGGVSMTGGDRQTLASGGHVVENCHFQKQGRWSKCYVPAIAMNGVGLRASNNLIHDHPHCAILFSGNDHLLEFNEIHHIALETGDVGAIYTGRDYTYRGNVIRHNFIHDTGGVGMGSMGVYMDDCASGTEIVGNIFYRVHWAMFIGGGRDHRVVNNLFVECDPAIRADGRGLDPSPVWRSMVDETMRRRLQDVPLALYRERYPALRSLDAHYGAPNGPALTGDRFKGVPPQGNLIAHNVCVGPWLDITWHARPEWFEIRDNTVGADVGVVNPPAGDFRLKPSSPVWKTEFKEIPVAKIGLRQDSLRAELDRIH